LKNISKIFVEKTALINVKKFVQKIRFEEDFKNFEKQIHKFRLEEYWKKLKRNLWQKLRLEVCLNKICRKNQI